MSTLTVDKFASSLVDSYHSQQARALSGAISYFEASSIFHTIINEAVRSFPGDVYVALDLYSSLYDSHLTSCLVCQKVVR